MPERTAPKPATHLEITIRYTVKAEQANIGGLLYALSMGFDAEHGDDERVSIPGGGKAELVKVKTVPRPE